MTAAEAMKDLDRLASDLPLDVDGVLADAAARVADRVAADWPEVTGRSKRGWRARGSEVHNDVPYTSHIRDGLADEVLPGLIDEELETIVRDIDQHVQGALQ
jgi:hypothetical protein